MKKLYALCLSLPVLTCTSGSAQNVSISEKSYLVLNGERFKNEKLVFNRAEGDWFITVNDAHGSVALFARYGGRELRLDLEWDGKKDNYPVNNENRHRVREAEFLLTMPDQKVYSDGLNSYPSGDDEVSITITRVDALIVSGTMNGIITEENEKIRLNGVFNLKRPSAPKNIVNSAYKDCDNVVHDKLTGAEGRSPSECEAKYDLDVRMAIHEAVIPVIEKFKNSDWQVTNETGLEPLTIVERGLEKKIFNSIYQIELQAAPTSATFTDYQTRYRQLTEKLKTPGKEGYEQFLKFGHEMNGATKSLIRFSVNNQAMSFVSFKGGVKIIKPSNTLFIIQSTYVQSRYGGGEEEATDASFILIGNWKQPFIEKLDDGGEQVRSEAILNPSASHLQAQNILIRIECNAATAGEIIKNLDLQKLLALISR